MRVCVKRLTDTARIPTRGSEGAAGYDLYADLTFPGIIHAGDTQRISTGISAEIPRGMVGLVYARSGLAANHGLRPANCVGVIDSDYRGEIQVALHNDTGHDEIVAPNQRIAQLVLMPYLTMEFREVDALSETGRGIGGFGSTGKGAAVLD